MKEYIKEEGLLVDMSCLLELSKRDVRRGIRIPSQITKELAELAGIIIGDGYLHKKNYTIDIVGSPEDKEYFLFLRDLICELFGVHPKVRLRQRALRITFKSKTIFRYLTEFLNLPFGKGKGEIVEVSDQFISKQLIIHLLRGLYDSDGSIYTSLRGGINNYPTIELTTTSKELAYQVMDMLWWLRFSVKNVREYKRRKSNNLPAYIVSLYGRDNVKLWQEKIGFSISRKQERLKKIMGAA